MEGPPSRTHRLYLFHARGRFAIAEGLLVDLQAYVRFSTPHHSPEDISVIGEELGVADTPREAEVPL